MRRSHTFLCLIIGILVIRASLLADSRKIVSIGEGCRIALGHAGTVVKISVEVVCGWALCDTLIVNHVHKLVIGALFHAGVVVSLSEKPFRTCGNTCAISRVRKEPTRTIVAAMASCCRTSGQMSKLPTGTQTCAGTGQIIRIGDRSRTRCPQNTK